MAGCCGGKNAGKPISKGRYLFGLSFFVTYHSMVRVALSGASLVNRRFRPVRDFHRQYYSHLLAEAWHRDGIALGKPDDSEDCALELDNG